VKRSSTRPRFEVTIDTRNTVNHAGSAGLVELADKIGLRKGFLKAMSKTRSRRSAHDPGRVLRDLVVMLADGGDCLSDLSAMRDQPDLFGHVASTPTAYRVIESIGPEELEGLREARALARARAWEMSGAPTDIVIDFDASLITVHSEKEGAAGNYKGGFGFHPLFGYLDQSREALAGLLRPGNAGANAVSDHLEVLAEVMRQLPEPAHAMPILVRSDSSGASHDFVDALRELEVYFSVGFDLTEPVREAILARPESAWVPALKQDGEEREGAAVCELVDLDLAGWPSQTRAICRRERPHPGAQLSFTDHNGYRFQCFITDQTDDDLAALEVRHRAHARVEDRIRCAKETGLENFPFRSFVANQVWLELVLAAQDLLVFYQRLCLEGEACNWEPKKLRYRLLHTVGRMIRTGRRQILRLQRNWPWTAILLGAFKRLRLLPANT
jgi:Transposase DDE domain group 1